MRKSSWFALALLFICSSVVFATEYTVVDLGILPGWQGAEPSAINVYGDIVGSGHWYDSDGNTVSGAYLWRGSSLQLLMMEGGNRSSACSINDSEQVVGCVDDSAVMWQDGKATALWTPPTAAAYGYSNAWDINNKGQITGYCDIRYPDNQQIVESYVYDNGIITNIGTLGGHWTRSHAINSRCQVVGGSDGINGYHAFLWQDGRMRDLGTLGGTQSWANDINDSGQIVGTSYNISSNHHAFLWENGVMKDLGTLGADSSEAFGINNLGQVVGYSSVSSGGSHGYLWEKGAMTDINNLIPSDEGWIISDAKAINDLEQIACVGLYKYDYNYHSVLVTPVTRISIDIKPENINMKSKGPVTVAVLTTSDFDATTIDPETVVFARAYPVRWFVKDVDRDGDNDMLLQFKTQSLQLARFDTSAALIGRASGKGYIKGSDAVQVTYPR